MLSKAKKTLTITALVSTVCWLAAGTIYVGGLKWDLSATDIALPPLTLQPLYDTQAVTVDKLKGQPFLINFWASWCVTCQAENEMLKSIRAEGVPLVGIVLKDTASAAQGWLDTFGSPFSLHLQDPEGHYADLLGVQGAPETFVIDGDGNIRYHYQGLIQKTVWENRIKPLLRSLTPTHDE